MEIKGEYAAQAAGGYRGTMQDAETRDIFQSQGFVGPLTLLSTEECGAILVHERGNIPAPLDWWKGRAATDPFYAKLAREEQILKTVRLLLGNDVILWGVDVLKREPSQVHPWHCDIESCAPDGGFVSVWIGIENTSRHSSLNCIGRSHRFERTVQEQAHLVGLSRGMTSDADILSWAKAFDPSAQCVTPDLSDGDAIIFDGRLWHGTNNTRSEGARTALLLQYASASRPVHMIDIEKLGWPFHFKAEPRPAVIVVSGRGDPTVNRIVEPPIIA